MLLAVARWVALFGALAFWLGEALAQDKEVSIGYQQVYNPWKVAIADKAFEAATGYQINWKPFDSGAQVINAIASGDIQIAMAGSSPIAAAVSQGLDVELFWVLEDIASAEALVVRDGVGIDAPQDLKGKRIGVPFVSTTHFHTLFALEQFGIEQGEVILRNLQPDEIVAAWSKGEIDAAFVWDPALGNIKESGKVLVTSGVLSSWGKATFDGLVSDRRWAADNPEFMVNFVTALVAADDAYRAAPESWTAESAEVEKIVSLIGGDPETVVVALSLYEFPTLAEQASSKWLSGDREGGAARALQFTSEFLMAERKIDSVLDDYSVAVNPTWVEHALLAKGQ